MLAGLAAGRLGAATMELLAGRRRAGARPGTPATPSTPLLAGLAALAFLGLVAVAWALGRAALALAPLAVAVVALAPFGRRSPWLGPVAPGLVAACAPLGAWLAVRGRLDPAAALLGGAVLTWVAGFELLRACQGFDLDHREGRPSIATRLGLRRALRSSTGLHAATVAALLALPLLVPAGAFFVAGVLVAAALLHHEHRLVGPSTLARLGPGFYRLNELVGVALLLSGALDLAVFGGTR